MKTSSHLLQINWSVWDNNPTVSWIYDGKIASVSLMLPPISVSHFSIHEMIAIVGNFDELGSSNLLLYSYDGVLQRTFTAPSLGQDSQYGGVVENREGVDAIVGFKSDTGWKEVAGKLDVNDGTLLYLHRNY